MTPGRLGLFASLLAPATLLLGCGAAEAEALNERSLPIVGGEASGAEQDSVVLLRTVVDGVDVLCSGTLVAPNLVLTARHCVSYLSQGLFGCSVRGEGLEGDPGAGRLGRHLPAEDFEIYGRRAPRTEPLARGREVLSTLSPTICTNDLAFLVLDRELDSPVSPLRVDGPARVGEPATLVGYGLEGQQEQLDYARAPRQQRRDISIVGVGPNSVDDVTSVPARTVILDGPSGCTGDSGGPLLAIPSGAVLGVYSLLNGESCTDPDVSHQLVHVPAFSGLIDEAFAAAGLEPVLEPRETVSAPNDGDGGASNGGSGSVDAGVAGVAGEPSPMPSGGATSPLERRAHDSSCSISGPMPAPRRGDILALLAAAAIGQRRQRRPSSGSA